MLTTDVYRLDDEFIYHQGKSDLILASLDPEDDHFLKISGPAATVVPLMEKGATYGEIAKGLLKKHPNLTKKLIDRNLPKMLKYLLENKMISKTARPAQKKASKRPSPEL